MNLLLILVAWVVLECLVLVFLWGAGIVNDAWDKGSERLMNETKHTD